MVGTNRRRSTFCRAMKHELCVDAPGRVRVHVGRVDDGETHTYMYIHTRRVPGDSS
ncbi:expressed unknown protein [Ectocarpus siliculosus]|uniref:Uncharacterized protein n=1 Tax=Ectocarpus siliculosus TaxID=2880 RepID=D8LBN8_ECTSI|nr:expressed unknown protein [Ectocarpus siliculosus]|eukprot:CBN76747.1 expressed unknown protein [Ectocarpus siliculosus]